MATSPARPAAPIKLPSTTTPSIVLADVISYGYAAAVMWGTLAFDLQFQVWQGVAVMVLFVLLRAVASELRKDARRQALVVARERAAVRAASPSRWTAEQRDGLGRRVDLEG